MKSVKESGWRQTSTTSWWHQNWKKKKEPTFVHKIRAVARHCFASCQRKSMGLWDIFTNEVCLQNLPSRTHLSRQHLLLIFDWDVTWCLPASECCLNRPFGTHLMSDALRPLVSLTFNSWSLTPIPRESDGPTFQGSLKCLQAGEEKLVSGRMHRPTLLLWTDGQKRWDREGEVRQVDEVQHFKHHGL